MTAPAGTEPTSTPRAPAGPGRQRRRRFPGWLGWSLLVALAVLLITGTGVWMAGSAPNDTPLHPGNPGPNGTMALAEVLNEHEVSVQTVENHRSLLNADPGPSDTVVITATQTLDPGVARQLRPTLQRAGRVIVVSDDFTRLADLRLPVSMIDTVPTESPAASCSGAVVPAEARTSDLTTAFRADDPAWQGCFGTDDGHGLVFGPYGQSTAAVIGSTDFARNDTVLDADNAQLSLWLYGSQSRVLWYLPDPNDTIDDGESDDVGIAPDWFAPIMVLLGFAVIGLMIARGRRFGPLSREPMPVVVSALETTRTRGRLYHGVGDIGHSAELLRTAAVRRLAHRLGLAGTADADQVADLLSTKHPSARALLTGPLPGTAEEAVRWLQNLRRLENEVADD